ncbi:MAG: hypothetical protein KA179_11095 [Sulfuritalea sp.]|nr:hypothetical protein [Sulfuritalea sp.]
MTDTVVTSGVTPWAQMIPEALALVPECPNPIIRDALHKAMREFFSTSRAWRGKQLTLLTTVVAQESYNANPPANAEVAQVMSCYRDTEEVECEVPGEEDDFYPAETGSDYRISVSDDGLYYELHPAPASAGEVLKGSVAYTLAENATGVPTWVYREHRYAIACGAAAHLVAQPGKPWTDREAYKAHRDTFEAAIRDASNAAGPIRRRPLRVTPY